MTIGGAEPITWALAGIFGGGFLLNKVRTILKDRHKQEMEKKRGPQEICQCKHGAAFHDGDGCRATEQVLVSEIPSKDRGGHFNGQFERRWNTERCSCANYVGPNTVPGIDFPLARTPLEKKTP